MKLLTVFALSAPFVEGFVGGGRGGLINTHHSFVTTPTVTKQQHTYSSPSPSSLTTILPNKNGIHPKTQLFLSDIPVKDDEERNIIDLDNDPIQRLKLQVNSMNFNAFINTAILIFISISVLNTIATIDSEIMRGWTAEEMAVRIPVDNWLSYSAVLEQSPLSTKAVTSATVYTIGDMIAQGTEGKSIGELDRPRVIRSLLAGLLGHGPMSHIWYDWSENLFENVMHLHGWMGTVIKVAIDQLTWGPFWNNTYILLLGIMQLEKPGKIFDEMKRTTIPLVVSGLKLWPLAHIVTYGLVPVENRLLWVDFVEIIWVTILASTAAAGGEGGHGGHGASTEVAEEEVDATEGIVTAKTAES